MIDIPRSTQTVDVQLINTTTAITIKSTGFIQPILPGHEFLHLPTFCFLIRHRDFGREILFDCGARKNWRDLPPSIVDVIAEAEIHIEKSVDELLVEGGYDLKKLGSIIWSHWHWDHIGDPSRFHPSTDVVVGPGFKRNFLPGYPIREEAEMLESDFENRTVREIEFDGSLMIGDFPAFDFFGDGSFYLLDVPGHAVGHIAAIARTTEDTFIFMAGDTCHFSGTFRPSSGMNLPEVIPPSVKLDTRFPRPCPSSCFMHVHPNPIQASSTPFYQVSQTKGGWYIDPQTAQASVASLEKFDAQNNILVVIAHDPALLDVNERFPYHNMNDWKKKGWKEKFAWSFLNELSKAKIQAL
ncbi:beta-lactamase-like protein [Halenospora varia]|nr:beta-lactamase-like protein [Halenospora varia]